jgi:hypothetical protein
MVICTSLMFSFVVNIMVDKSFVIGLHVTFNGIYVVVLYYGGGGGGGVCWATVLQAGMSRVHFPMVSMEFFINIIHPATQWPLGWLSLLIETSTMNISWGLKAAGPYGWQAYHMLLWYLGASSSWNPHGLSRDCFTFLLYRGDKHGVAIYYCIFSMQVYYIRKIQHQLVAQHFCFLISAPTCFGCNCWPSSGSFL